LFSRLGMDAAEEAETSRDTAAVPQKDIRMQDSEEESVRSEVGGGEEAAPEDADSEDWEDIVEKGVNQGMGGMEMNARAGIEQRIARVVDEANADANADDDTAEDLEAAAQLQACSVPAMGVCPHPSPCLSSQLRAFVDLPSPPMSPR